MGDGPYPKPVFDAAVRILYLIPPDDAGQALVLDFGPVHRSSRR